MAIFDEIIDRRNTNSLKYDFAVEFGKPADALPMWLADMDFRAAPPVLEALSGAVAHGIFGYSDVKGDYYDALSGWYARRFGWRTERDWLVKTPGVMFAVAMAMRAVTHPGDGVLIQTPVYHPFYSVIRDNGRVLVENELRNENGRYCIDFEDFERKIVENRVKMFILCSPHNPVCRVWTPEELRRMGAICRDRGVYIVSDEIHCDFTWAGHPHTPLFKADPALADRAILCTSPSKTFNLAGLQISNIWIPDPALRAQIRREIDATGYTEANALGLVACQAAYERGEAWFDRCLAYIRGNLDWLRENLSRIPGVRLVEPEGTYFAWLDFSGLGLCRQELRELRERKAGLWLGAGHGFGKQSGQFQRMVLACPRATVEEALRRLERAIQDP